MKKNDKEFIDRLFEKKREFHQKQAAMPVEEKIKILVKLQEIYIAMQVQRGIKTDKVVWKL